MTTYKLPIFDRLYPRTEWRGRLIAHTDVLTLPEAAAAASQHAGTQITPADFLRAAARGQITLRAIVHTSARVQKHDGGIYCNAGEPTENVIPKGSIPTLPIDACTRIANTGRASWRTFDGYKIIDDMRCSFTIATIVDGQPDFETTADDCRVTGDAVHALADAFIDSEERRENSGAANQDKHCTRSVKSSRSAHTTAQSGPAVTKLDLIDGLGLEKKWEEILRRPDSDGKRYRDALVSKGARGRAGSTGTNQSMWNPVVFARLAIENGKLNRSAVIARFKKSFPQWQDELEAELNS
ncbi:hypothetical protein [Azonexus sp. IMCC34839]|uniref:hypothetical protein n=1 Tax=Azonexus sp. IMCC34839 TaxID=3133695 RepID=UPI003999DBA9